MSSTGLEVFDDAIRRTIAWTDEIAGALGVNRQDAWHALGAVLRPLRDRLPAAVSAEVAAQLPLLVRGAYFERWRPSRVGNAPGSLAEFLEEVSDGLVDRRPIGSVDATRAVFAALASHLGAGAAGALREALPEDIRSLWPEPAAQVPASESAAKVAG